MPKTIGGRELSLIENEFINTARYFYNRGLSVNEMIQMAYEAQLSSKRAEGKPAQINVKEKTK